MRMKSFLTTGFTIAAILGMGLLSVAQAIPMLDPCSGGDCVQIGPVPGNDNATNVSTELGYDVTELFKSDPPGSDGSGVVVNDDGDMLSGDWTSLVDIAAVVVKAGDNFMIQDYWQNGAGSFATSGLWSTWPLVVGQNQNQPEVSHITFFTFDDGGTVPGGEIPEPGTILLLGTGLMGLGIWRLKRKQ